MAVKLVRMEGLDSNYGFAAKSFGPSYSGVFLYSLYNRARGRVSHIHSGQTSKRCKIPWSTPVCPPDTIVIIFRSRPPPPPPVQDAGSAGTDSGSFGLMMTAEWAVYGTAFLC